MLVHLLDIIIRAHELCSIGFFFLYVSFAHSRCQCYHVKLNVFTWYHYFWKKISCITYPLAIKSLYQLVELILPSLADCRKREIVRQKNLCISCYFYWLAWVDHLVAPGCSIWLPVWRLKFIVIIMLNASFNCWSHDGSYSWSIKTWNCANYHI